MARITPDPSGKAGWCPVFRGNRVKVLNTARLDLNQARLVTQNVTKRQNSGTNHGSLGMDSDEAKALREG